MHSQRLLVVSCLILLSWTVTAEQLYVTPSSNTSCPQDACYTLTDVVQNPTQYFASNTVITFLPGYHQTNFTGLYHTVLINNVRNISMIGYTHSRTVIHCGESFGFMFKNVTSLNIIKLHFSFCGARFPSNFIVYPYDFETLLKIPSTKVSQVTLYFLQTTNVTISEVDISNSIGAGLLGVNMIGVSNILHSTLSGNRPNCLLMFLDMPSMSDINLLTVLNIKEVQATFGSRPHQKGHQYHHIKYAIQDSALS